MAAITLGLTALVACKTVKQAGSGTSGGGAEVRDLNVEAASGVTMDVNDLSILFPTDANGLPYPQIVLSTGTDANGRPLWPQQTAFQAMLDFGQGKTVGTVTNAPFFTGQEGGDTPDAPEAPGETGLRLAGEQKKIELPITLAPGSAVANQANWRVVGLRADPCAEQGPNACNVEFRLIVQPFQGRTAIDTAAHLLYNMGSLSVDRSGTNSELGRRNPNLPVSVTFQTLIKDLLAIKAQSGTGAGATNGRPLGVHPGLAAELAAQGNQGASKGQVANLVDRLIKTYTQGGLTVVTTMELNNPPLPWIFYQGTVTNNVWNPISITGGSPQMSVRFGGGAGGFTPVPQNKSGDSNHAILAGAPTANDFRTVFKIDNPGVFNGPAQRNSVENTDCLSCHVGATAIQDNQAMSAVANGIGVMYVPADGITGYMGTGTGPVQGGRAPQAVASGIWDFRNFGMSDNTISSSIESRMLNEAAEAARFVNEDLFHLQGKNPGFVCQPGASDQQRQQNHARMWDCNVKAKTPFAQCAAQICPNATGLPGGTNPPPTPQPGACTQPPGGNCGSSLGLDPNTLFSCVNQRLVTLARCANGCQVNPNGVADVCRQPPTPGFPPCNFPDGDVCGSTLGIDPNSLFTCKNGGTSLKTRCQNGCQINPGVSDTCITAPPNPGGVACNVAPVPSCGGAFGQDPKALFSCRLGRLVKLQDCANGCQTNPAGVADACVAGPTAPCRGLGAICGQSLGLDSNTLFQCVLGRASLVARCPAGCQVNPGRQDTCAFQAPQQPSVACFTDPTASCGGSFGLDPNSVFSCRNNKTVLVQACGGRGCRAMPAGQADICN